MAAPDGAPEFFHGYTYSAHPAACAAGLATLEIYRSEQLFAKGRELSGYFLDAMFALQDLPAVSDVRGSACWRVSKSNRARLRACAAGNCRRSCSIAACT